MIPARILGLEDQLGSVAEGKLANLQILTGDPLQATTWVDTVLLEGEVVYERSKDPRLQYLFGDEKDKTSKAGGPEAGEKKTPAGKSAGESASNPKPAGNQQEGK